MLSTQITIVLLLVLQRNTYTLLIKGSKPSIARNSQRHQYYRSGDYLSPQSALSSRYTMPGIWKLSGMSTQIVYQLIGAFKKAVLISNCLYSRLQYAIIANRIRRDASLQTAAYVSSQSIPFFQVKLRTTYRALKRTIVLFVSLLIVNTYRPRSILEPLASSAFLISYYVLFSTKLSISTLQASNYYRASAVFITDAQLRSIVISAVK